MTRIRPFLAPARLRSDDYESFVDSTLEMQTERDWALTPYSWKHSHEEPAPVFSWMLHRSTDALEKHHQMSAFASAMATVLSQFAVSAAVHPFQVRMDELERRLLACEQGSFDTKLDKSRQLLDEVKQHVSTIVAIFQNAFSGVHPHVLIMPGDGEDSDLVRVVLDASDADPTQISKARQGGARISFLTELSNQLPGPLFGALDLEFIFDHAR